MNDQESRFANQLNIQWFPGHMTKTLRMMEQEIQHVDASLVLLDARIPLSSLNPEIERITARKPKLYALNKADLADPAVTAKSGSNISMRQMPVAWPSAPSRTGGAKAVQTAIETELSAPAGPPRSNRGMARCARPSVMLVRHPQCGQIDFYQHALRARPVPRRQTVPA